MYDIVRFTPSNSSFNFSKLFSTSKLLEADNLVHAATLKNRKAIVLLKDYAYDDGAMKLIAEKKALCFVIDLGRLIRSSGISRAVAISKLRNFLKLANKHGAYYAFASFSKSPEEMRSPDELIHIAMLLGINRGQSKFALEMAKEYLS